MQMSFTPFDRLNSSPWPRHRLSNAGGTRTQKINNINSKNGAYRLLKDWIESRWCLRGCDLVESIYSFWCREALQYPRTHPSMTHRNLNVPNSECKTHRAIYTLKPTRSRALQSAQYFWFQFWFKLPLPCQDSSGAFAATSGWYS